MWVLQVMNQAFYIYIMAPVWLHWLIDNTSLLICLNILDITLALFS